MKANYLILFLIGFICMPMNAQKKINKCTEEDFRAKKQAYMTQKAGLTEEESKTLAKRKKIVALVSVVIAVALFVWLGVYLTDVILFSVESGEGIEQAAANFKALIESYGNVGILVAFGIQVLQVVVSPIPGEVVEVGMGLCFGWFGGALICLIGVALASAIIMEFVKKFGFKFVELFIPIEKIQELRFINSEKKLSRFVFLLYLIPGTPKDPLIFFFGLTKIRTIDFVIISTIARIPSVVSSTIGGKFIVDQNYVGAILVFIITGIFSLAGLILYRKILSKMSERKEKKELKKTNQ